MDGLEIERVGEHEFESGLLAGVRQPIPAEQAFAAHRHVVTPWGDFLEEELEIVVLDVHVQQLVALAVHHADIHLARMEIDSAVILACRSVVFHLFFKSHLWVGFWKASRDPHLRLPPSRANLTQASKRGLR